MAEDPPALEPILASAREWAASPEGQEAVRLALAEARAMTDELERARRIDYRDLNTPLGEMTVRRKGA